MNPTYEGVKMFYTPESVLARAIIKIHANGMEHTTAIRLIVLRSMRDEESSAPYPNAAYLATLDQLILEHTESDPYN